MEEDYQIERVLGRRGRKGAYQYHIKWLGYGDEDNTWEKREDLVADGFEEEVDKFDAAQREKKKSGTKRSAAAETTSRARSKTPVRAAVRAAVKVTEVVEVESEEEKEQEDKDSAQEKEEEDVAEAEGAEEGVEEEEEEQEEEQERGDDEDEDSDPSKIDVDTNAVLRWLVMFFCAAMASVVAHAIKVKLDPNATQDKTRVNMFILLVDPLPMVLCIRMILKTAPSTDFSNLSAAMLIWIGMTKFCEAIKGVFPGETNQNEALLFSMGFWQLLTLLALFSPPETRPEALRSALRNEKDAAARRADTVSNAVTVALFAVVVGGLVKLADKLPFNQPEMAVLALALFATARGKARMVGPLLFGSEPVPFYLYLELFGAILGTLFVTVQLAFPHGLVPVQETYPVKIRGMDGMGHLELPLFRITHDIFAWSTCAAFMCSSIMYHK